MEFSVIIPVFHGNELLKKSLDSLSRLANQSHDVEIVVVYRGGETGNEQIVSEFLRVSPFPVIGIPMSSKNRSQMLNAAVKKSSGAILAFIDDDCLVPPEWLHTISDSLKGADRCGIVGGRDVPAGPRKPFDESLDVVLSSFFGTAGIRAPGSGMAGNYFPRLWNMAFSRSSIEILSAREQGRDLFDANLIVNEDVALGIRMKQAGIGICYNPRLVVGHYRETGFWTFVARNYSMGYTSRILGVNNTPHGILALAIGIVMILIPASLVMGLFQEILLVVAVIFGAVCSCTMIANERNIKNFATFAWIPFVLSGLYLSRGLGYLAGSIGLVVGGAGNRRREQRK